jgi:hypothetical protein
MGGPSDRGVSFPADSGLVEQGRGLWYFGWRVVKRDAFRDGRGRGECRELVDQPVQGPGGAGGPCLAGGAR